MQVLAQTHSPVAFTIHRILCLFFPLLVGIIQHTCKGYLLISSHNLPPSEANTRERGVCWGHPRPRQEASPPAPLSSDCMSVTCSPGRVHYYGWRDAPGVDIHGSGCPVALYFGENVCNGILDATSYLL